MSIQFAHDGLWLTGPKSKKGVPSNGSHPDLRVRVVNFPVETSGGDFEEQGGGFVLPGASHFKVAAPEEGYLVQLDSGRSYNHDE